MRQQVNHLFNHIARDGCGYCVVIGLGFKDADGHGWSRGGVTAKLPITLALREGDGALHLNAGVGKLCSEKREGLSGSVSSARRRGTR